MDPDPASPWPTSIIGLGSGSGSEENVDIGQTSSSTAQTQMHAHTHTQIRDETELQEHHSQTHHAPGPAPSSHEMDEDPQDPDPTTPMNLSGALEKQARQAEAEAADATAVESETQIETNEITPSTAAATTTSDLLLGIRTDQTSNLDELEQQSTSSSSSLFNNPPNLSRIRRVLFECADPIEISVEEFETYWPFIDNVWVKQRSNASKEGHCTTDYYMCRLRRPTHRTSDTRPLPQGKRPRKKRVREGGICNFQIKVVRFEGAYSTVTIARTPGSSDIHSHDLDFIDRVKRNSGLMESARRESEKGYLPSSIYTKFQEQPAKLQEAGGRFLTVTDVRNVSAKWRIQNPEVKLVPHEGYEYQKGHGIVKAPGADRGEMTATTDIIQGGAAAAAGEGRGAGAGGTKRRRRADSDSAPSLPPDILSFPHFDLDFLQPYLPHHVDRREFPHVTLSYASSMDSKISLRAGMQTVLSGPEAKLMTHYLRSRHDAILIGVGTVLADNPGLNCRLEGAGGFGGLGRMWQPRPVVIDPTGRWPVHPDCRMLRTAVEGKGKAPWVVVSPGAQINPQTLMMLKGYGGDFLRIVEYNQHWRLHWEGVLRALASEGIKSVMIEGGGTVLSELLNPEYAHFIDSIIVTVAPTYLGRGGVGVSPHSKLDQEGNPNAALNPREVKWTPLGQNVIMCGKIRPEGDI